MQKCGVCKKRSVATQIEWIACPGCEETICEECKKSVPFFAPLDAYFCSDKCQADYVTGVVVQAVNEGNLATYVEDPKGVGGAFKKTFYTPKRINYKGHMLYFWMADGYPASVRDATIKAQCERFASEAEKSAKKV